MRLAEVGVIGGLIAVLSAPAAPVAAAANCGEITGDGTVLAEQAMAAVKADPPRGCLFDWSQAMESKAKTAEAAEQNGKAVQKISISETYRFDAKEKFLACFKDGVQVRAGTTFIERATCTASYVCDGDQAVESGAPECVIECGAESQPDNACK